MKKLHKAVMVMFAVIGLVSFAFFVFAMLTALGNMQERKYTPANAETNPPAVAAREMAR